MKQIFDWLREQIKNNCHEIEDGDGEKYEVISIGNAVNIITVGEAKWKADVCEWKYNETEDIWESSCGHLLIFMADGPKENEYAFCPYCGRRIAEVK